jgi:hypothetical protein
VLGRENAKGVARLREGNAQKNKQYAHVVRTIPFGGARSAHDVLAVQ